MQLSYKLDEIERAARYLIDQASTAVIRIDGSMGAGKTTLISAVVKILGVTDTVCSPTFSLVNNYQKENEVINHFDFYRLNHPDEALDIGLEEYLESGNLCLLEWAEKVIPHLPLEYDHFIIVVQSDESRVLKKLKH
jgi:tRNA threonylcarbamoyladenosine biosynthesis protein TsaE